MEGGERRGQRAGGRQSQSLMNAESVELDIYGRAAHLVLGGKREENPSRGGESIWFSTLAAL